MTVRKTVSGMSRVSRLPTWFPSRAARISTGRVGHSRCAGIAAVQPEDQQRHRVHDDEVRREIGDEVRGIEPLLLQQDRDGRPVQRRRRGQEPARDPGAELRRRARPVGEPDALGDEQGDPQRGDQQSCRHPQHSGIEQPDDDGARPGAGRAPEPEPQHPRPLDGVPFPCHDDDAGDEGRHQVDHHDGREVEPGEQQERGGEEGGREPGRAPSTAARNTATTLPASTIAPTSPITPFCARRRGHNLMTWQHFPTSSP